MPVYTSLEKIVLSNTEKEWCWSKLTRNPKISLEFIDLHPELPWSHRDLALHPHMTLFYIEKFIDKFDSSNNWSVLTQHPNFEISWVKRFPESNWSYYWILTRNDFQIEWLEFFESLGDLHKTLTIKSNQFVIANNLSIHPSLELSWLEKYPNLPWKWMCISNNPRLDISWIMTFPKANWDWTILSNRQELNLEWLTSLADAPWDWQQLSYRYSRSYINCCEMRTIKYPVIPDWILAFPEVNWNWTALSHHPDVSLEWFKIFPGKPWNWKTLASHSGFQVSWLDYIPRDVILKEGLTTGFRNIVDTTDKIEILIALNEVVPLTKYRLFSNPHLTLEWIRLINDNWNPSCNEILCLVSHPKITPEWVNSYPHWDWLEVNLSQHPNLKILDVACDWFRRIPLKYWSRKILSSHHLWHPQWLECFPRDYWDYSMIGSFKENGITLDILTQESHREWNWGNVSKSQYFTLEWVERFPDKPWDFSKMSQSRNFQIEWVEKFPDKNWNFQQISRHSSLLVEWIMRFPLANWDLRHIQTLSQFHPKWLLKVYIQGWNWKPLSRDPRMTLTMGLKMRHYPWDLRNLHFHPALSTAWFKKLPEVVWNLDLLSRHPNLRHRWFGPSGPCQNKTYLRWNINMMSGNRCNYVATLEYWCKRRQLTHQHLNHYKEELIQKTWAPSRFMEWCLDMEDKERWYQYRNKD